MSYVHARYTMSHKIGRKIRCPSLTVTPWKYDSLTARPWPYILNGRTDEGGKHVGNQRGTATIEHWSLAQWS